MFRKNDHHRQQRLFDDFQNLHSSQQKRLMASWAPVFYEHVFCQIDETPFAVLYCADNGRPNFPVNILLALEFYKHWQDLTDEQLLEQAAFNYQVMYAIGLRNLGEEYIAPRTLYDFRTRIYRYLLENPKTGDLIFTQFNKLTAHFIEETGAKTDEQRTDSSLISANIQKMHRVSLVFDVLYHAIADCPETLLSPELKEILSPTFKTNVLYRTRSSSSDERIANLLNLGQKLLNLQQIHPQIAANDSFKLLERLILEQGIWNESKKAWEAKPNSDISPASLQSAHDPDATYRQKGHKDHVGYVANITETCSQENKSQFVTDYMVEPNITSDIDMLNQRLPVIKQHTGVEKMYTDGGYYSETIEQTAVNNQVEIAYSDLTGKKTTSQKLPYTDFTIENRCQIKACPQRHEPHRHAFNEKTKVLSAHFNLTNCKNCPLLSQCPVKLQKKEAVVRVSQKTILADETRKKLANGGKREIISRRTAIEGTHSALKRSQGLNKLAVRGKNKVNTVTGLKVIGHNIQQFITFLTRKAKATMNQVAEVFAPKPPQGASLSF